MKIYKVDYFIYDQANSLLPPHDPVADEVSPIEAVVPTPSAQDLIQLFIKLGYTPHQAEHLYKALFNHYWYDFGFRAVHKINELIYFWQKAYLAPAWAQVGKAPKPFVPPAVIYAVVAVAIIAVVVVLVAPDWKENYKWYPPCTLYLGVYHEELWWMTLWGITEQGKTIYEAMWYSGGVISAHTYEYIAPPVFTDRFHFWGTLESRCWQLPWFRVYRAQFADCTFIGSLEHLSAHLYALKGTASDPFAPPGPIAIPPADYCKVGSPCG